MMYGVDIKYTLLMTFCVICFCSNFNSVHYFIAYSILNDEVILKVRNILCVITQAAAKYKIPLGRTKRRLSKTKLIYLYEWHLIIL